MTHAPKFWAEKLVTEAQRQVFWALVARWNYSGESAYYIVQHEEVER